MNKFTIFLQDVRVELGRVSWPTRKQTINYTLAVVVMSLITAAFLGALDAVFAYLLTTFIS